MNPTKRFSIAFLLSSAAFCTSALALAETPATPSCEGHDGKAHHDGKGKGAHFKKADKNNDGFLTQAEVGEKRWARISVADANKDAKVSQAEMQQARKDGKLGRGKHSKKA